MIAYIHRLCLGLFLTTILATILVPSTSAATLFIAPQADDKDTRTIDIIQLENGEEIIIETDTSLRPGLLTETSSDIDNGVSSDPCLNYTYGVNIRNANHNKFGSFAQNVGWCYNGTQVTTHQYSYRIEDSLLVRYDGVISEKHAPGHGDTYYEDNATVKFSVSALGQELLVVYPYVNIVVRGDGTYSGSGGGGDFA